MSICYIFNDEEMVKNLNFLSHELIIEIVAGSIFVYKIK